MTYHRVGLLDIQVLKFEFPAKNEGRILPPHTRQTSECADQLLLQAIDKFFYFVLIKYVVENKSQNRHAF